MTPPAVAGEDHETVLEFPDNRLLIDLCGEFDRNLAQIEHELDVHIMRRGNKLSVIGDAREARDFGRDFEFHATHLLVHATLHLLGYDHISPPDARLMEGIEREILARSGFGDPYEDA